jgi:hypothetical protein
MPGVTGIRAKINNIRSLAIDKVLTLMAQYGIKNDNKIKHKQWVVLN